MSTMPVEVVALRSPCGTCGAVDGIATPKSGQDVVSCSNGHYCYCRPKTESGKETRSVRSRPTLKPSTRWRILERDSFRCLACGRRASDVTLHVDHFLPLEMAGEHGLTQEEAESDDNLVTLCEECNLGKTDTPPRPRSVFAILLRTYRGNPER